MRFGIFSNGTRQRTLAADTYDEDLAEIVAADRLGYDEAWISEHVGAPLPDTLPVADYLLIKAAAMTERIRLGPGVRVLPLYHPLDVAYQATTCDHLLRGRYMFGFGSGGPNAGNMERRGMVNADRHTLERASIEYILKVWTEPEPFDSPSEFWPGTGIHMYPRPFQDPHPPVAVATSQPPMMEFCAQHGFSAMLSSFVPTPILRRNADVYAAAASATHGTDNRSKLIVAAKIHVTETVAEAKRQLEEGVGHELQEWKNKIPGLIEPCVPSGVAADATVGNLIDGGFFKAGDPDTVYHHVIHLYEELGGFGTILLTLGHDWGTLEERIRSMELFMTEVAPRLRLLDPDSEAPGFIAKAQTATPEISEEIAQIAEFPGGVKELAN